MSRMVILTTEQEDAAAQRLAPGLLTAALAKLQERPAGKRKAHVSKTLFEGTFYQRRKMAGTCVNCGKRPPALRRVRCDDCLARYQEARRERRRRARDE